MADERTNPGSSPVPAEAGGQEVQEIKAELIEVLGAEPEKVNRVLELVIRHQLHMRSAPIPAPEEFAEYANVDPAIVTEILAAWREQRQHRMAIELLEAEQPGKELRADTFKHVLGQFSGFVIAILLIVAAVYTALHGWPWVAGVMMGAGGLGILGRIIDGRKAKIQDKAEVRVTPIAQKPKPPNKTKGGRR